MAVNGLQVRVNGKKATCTSGKGRKRSSKGTGAKARKECQKQNGRLKKGWRYGKGGRCVRAKG